MAGCPYLTQRPAKCPSCGSYHVLDGGKHNQSCGDCGAVWSL